jgi:hypothetical protein
LSEIDEALQSRCLNHQVHTPPRTKNRESLLKIKEVDSEESENEEEDCKIQLSQDEFDKIFPVISKNLSTTNPHFVSKSAFISKRVFDEDEKQERLEELMT